VNDFISVYFLSKKNKTKEASLHKRKKTQKMERRSEEEEALVK